MRRTGRLEFDLLLVTEILSCEFLGFRIGVDEVPFCDDVLRPTEKRPLPCLETLC
jgi:hypothetical protein